MFQCRHRLISCPKPLLQLTQLLANDICSMLHTLNHSRECPIVQTESRASRGETDYNLVSFINERPQPELAARLPFLDQARRAQALQVPIHRTARHSKPFGEHLNSHDGMFFIEGRQHINVRSEMALRPQATRYSLLMHNNPASTNISSDTNISFSSMVASNMSSVKRSQRSLWSARLHPRLVSHPS